MCESSEPVRFQQNGAIWNLEWIPEANGVPNGTPHGSAAICFTKDHGVVLVSHDFGKKWEFPAGRAEPGENWLQTVKREVMEEACALTETATVLGFSRGKCLSGPEKGLVLVRACFKASVILREWDPKFETTDRQLVQLSDVLDYIYIPKGAESVYKQWINHTT
ncbi:MAG: NUDIX domain-containing protein [Chitinispirillia bacterium]